jgi:hypothetical protein
MLSGQAVCDHQEQKRLQTTEGLPSELPRTDPPISTEATQLLLGDISNTFGDKLLTPDDLRGNYDSLRSALRAVGPSQFWPDLDAARGKVIAIVGGKISDSLDAVFLQNLLCARLISVNAGRDGGALGQRIHTHGFC